MSEIHMEDEVEKLQEVADAFNERLRAAGLPDAFQKAIESSDADDLKEVLKGLGYPDEDIATTLSALSGMFRPKGFDPNGFVPRDKHDDESANRAIGAGYPAVEPVLSYLLEWIQDMNWPVAQTLAPFLATIGTPLVPYIKKVFETDDEIWKYWIMGEIFLESPEVAEEFRDELKRIAYAPTQSEITEELPERALDVLQHYGWE
jgi:hypothetical protein